MYDEWIEKNNINEDNGWEEFESLFDAEQEETKLERIYRFILIQYMLERNILFLLDERNFREIIAFKDTCDIELYMFLRQKFNVSGERTESMNKIQRVWISFKDEILKTIVTFYKPTDRFKRKFFSEDNKDISQSRYSIIIYEMLMPTTGENVNVYSELLDSDISQMRIVNQIDEKVKEKQEQLEKIEKNLQEKEKK